LPGTFFEIRYPNGDFEIDGASQSPPPLVGEMIRRRGKLWRVTGRFKRGTLPVVRVEPAQKDSSAR
jgi:hypothetical protein